MTVLTDLARMLWPLLAVTGGALVCIWVSHRVAARISTQYSLNLKWQLLDILIVAAALIGVVIALPLSDETQGQVLSLLGVVLTGVIGLSSTTFVSNSMAGLMLQISQPFRPGDYVKVEQQFGRVISISLVQTRIQTETRDVATLPNIMLINNPVTVVRHDGTIISADVSLGYDLHHNDIENMLEAAAVDAGLDDPWVMVQDLLDHCVLYRVNGMLTETKNLLSARSRLRRCVLDQLHGHGVEIVSPSFMNQRPTDPNTPVIATRHAARHKPARNEDADDTAPEDLIFDVAEEAATQEEIKQKLEQTTRDIKDTEQAIKDSNSDNERAALQRKLARWKRLQLHYQNALEPSENQ